MLWMTRGNRVRFTGGMGCAIHFAEPTDKGGDDKGKDGSDRKAGGGGGADDKKGGTPKTYDVPVGDGTVVKMTEEEVLAAASKASGADKKFQEAAKLRQQYDGLDPEKGKKGQRILDLSAKGESMTQAEAQEFFGLLGIDPNAKPEGGKKPKTIEFDALDPRVQDAVKTAETAQIEKLESQIKEKVKKTVDTDKTLVTLRDGLPKERQASFMDTLYEMAIDETLNRVYTGQKLGPELLELVVQRLRKRAENLGIPELLKNRAPTSQRIPGLESLGQGIHAEEPIKRVPVGKDENGDNAVARLAQKILLRRRTG